MAWRPDNVRKWSALVLLATIGTALTAATNPGFVAVISQKGLDFACQQGVAVLKKELQGISIPDFSGEILKTKHRGKGYYNFYSMAVEEFQIPSPQIKLMPSDSLQLSINDASIKINGKWKSRKNFLKGSGKFGLSIQGVSISADLKLGTDSSGHITVTCPSCIGHINNIHVQVSGGMLGWLIQLFHKKIETSLKSTVYKKICKIVSSSVSSNLQPYLRTLPMIARVDDVAVIDYSLVAPLKITAEFLEGQLKGQFFWREQPHAFPIVPPSMSFSPSHDHMVSLGISNYFFSTAGFVYQESGTLRVTLRNQMLPKDARFQLNTEFFGTFLPKVAMKFPSMEVQLVMSASLPPRVSIQPSGLSLNPAMETQAFAVLPNSSLAPLFLLGMKMNASLEVDAKKNKLIGELKLDKVTLKLKNSDIGLFKCILGILYPLWVELLEAVINYLMPTLVLPKINERLHRGFPLPLPAGVHLNNVMFHSYENFLVLEADVYGT